MILELKPVQLVLIKLVAPGYAAFTGRSDASTAALWNDGNSVGSIDAYYLNDPGTPSIDVGSTTGAAGATLLAGNYAPSTAYEAASSAWPGTFDPGVAPSFNC